jgi:alpha-1,2-mannosyltransferase
MLSVLRDARWLNGARARAYTIILAIMLGISALVTVRAHFAEAARDPGGRAPATDFLPFYAAGRLASAGRAADAYRLEALTEVQQHFAVVEGGRLPFLYPPVFLQPCAMIAMLPFGWAWLAFQAAGVFPLLISLRRLLPQRWALLPTLSAPAVLINAGSGQTGAHVAACFAAAALTLDRWPFLGGASLGLLVCKPQFAVLVPVALLLARRWRAFVGFGATALGLCALSWAVFGTATWMAFLAQASLSREILEHWSQSRFLISVFGAARLLGTGLPEAYLLQALSALAALVLVAATALRRPGGIAEVAVLAAATLFATPYAMDYDLPDLLLPVVWIVAEAQCNGWRSWEKLILCAGFVLPLFVRLLVVLAGMPVAPPVLAGVLVLAALRARERDGHPLLAPYPSAPL